MKKVNLRKKINTLAVYVPLQNDTRIRGAVHDFQKLGANAELRPRGV
jgi:hypothetical protein